MSGEVPDVRSGLRVHDDYHTNYEEEGTALIHS
jgi:hypothetical protein